MGWDLLAGFAFGVAIATLTTPVGVSGAVFLLPVQLSVLNVPSPAVTPTNLLYNVVSVPGALARYRSAARLGSVLARRLLAGTVPGVVVGAVIRVYALPDGSTFKILVALLLLPLGAWLLFRDRRPAKNAAVLGARTLTGLGFAAGLAGGIYGIAGGSLLAPVLVAAGYLVAEVAPAALLSTFVTSCVGAGTYALLALTDRATSAPNWSLGIACGLGGLIGGYLGASIQPRVPQRLLRLLLGIVAMALGAAYLLEAVLR